MKLSPENFDVNLAAAWVFATCRDEEFRDEARALKSAKIILSRPRVQNVWFMYDAAAAALANHGDWGEAIKLATRAKQLAPDAEKTQVIERMKLYQAKRPYQQDPRELDGEVPGETREAKRDRIRG